MAVDGIERRWKYSISTGCWYSAPIDEVIKRIADAGYDALSIGAKAEQDPNRGEWKLIYHLGLAVDSVHAAKVDLSAICDTERKIAVDKTLNSIIFAHELQCPFVVIHPCEKLGLTEKEFEVRIVNFGVSLYELMLASKKYGILLALENMDKPKDLFFEKVYEEAITQGISICYDSGHAYVQSDPIVWWDRLESSVKVLHLNDNNGEADTHESLGDGSFPWHLFVSRLKRSNYQGYIGLESKYRGESSEGFSRWLKHNLCFIRKILEEEVS